jgi:hypothetical protein
MTIDINEQEREYLLEILKAEHSSLLDELLHTDSFEYKELLRQKFELLKKLEARFETSVVDSSTV